MFNTDDVFFNGYRTKSIDNIDDLKKNQSIFEIEDGDIYLNAFFV
jgi:hypothetical protein